MLEAINSLVPFKCQYYLITYYVFVPDEYVLLRWFSLCDVNV